MLLPLLEEVHTVILHTAIARLQSTRIPFLSQNLFFLIIYDSAKLHKMSVYDAFICLTQD